jgi:hypothetical protein
MIMNDIVQNWLDNPLLCNVQACSIRSTSGQYHTQVAGTDLSNEDFERAMGIIAEAVPQLMDQGLLPGRILWNFANANLHYAVRSDLVSLGLYCRSDSNGDSSAVNEFIDEFMQHG